MSVDSRLEEHLNEEELHVFLQSPENARHVRKRRHLAECDSCRNKAAQLQIGQEFVLANVEVISQSSYSSDVTARLHQLTHESAMADMTSNFNDSKQTRRLSDLFSTVSGKIRQALSTRETLFTIPATAVATLFVAFLFIGEHFNQEREIVSFQDSPSLVMSKNSHKPGLGFFHNTNKEESLVDYSGFNVSSDPTEGHIKVSWPEIDGALRYDVALEEISHNVSQQIDKISTNKTRWFIDRSSMRSGLLYRLTLTGTTKTDFTFRHTGGFVLRN